jgi:glucosamine kinase
MPIKPRHSRQASVPKAPRWCLGVDGGGTHTRLRLHDNEGRALGEGHAGPSALGQGAVQAWAALDAALQQAATAADLAEKPAWCDCALGLGLSGAASPVLAEAFLAGDPGCASIALDTDGFTALLGAHGGQAGALVIAGTGSVGEALLPGGQRLQVGGWGWQNGDEGSGAWLGLAAVRQTQRVLDGRLPEGPLAASVCTVAQRETGIAEAVPALLAWSAAAGQRRYASLAPLVFAHEGDDPAARHLLARAVAELEALALALDPEGALPLALSGSIAARLAPRLGEPVRGRCVSPQGDAMAGALHLILAKGSQGPH